MNNNKKLPRPTAEVIKEYIEVSNKFDGLDPSWSDDEANEVLGRMNEFENNYDWSHVEFTDPITGKKGLKSVMDEPVVPALYDSFPSPGTRLDPWEPIIAVLDGKYGVLDGRGGGEVIAPFEYDEIFYENNGRGYVGRKGNNECPVAFIDNEGYNPAYNPNDLYDVFT